ncbi:MAG: hypothetical protein COW34_04700, partial [Armatimonadetes bacterium CG17_big_fil_post_rev_8_21_14_2_50_66_6]
MQVSAGAGQRHDSKAASSATAVRVSRNQSGSGGTASPPEVDTLSENVAQIIDQIKNLTLLEAKELYEGMQETFGIAAMAPVAAAPAGGAAEAAEVEEQTEFAA